MKKVVPILLTVLMIVSCGQQPRLLSTATVEATATKNVATITPSQTQNPTETPSHALTQMPSITPTGTLTEWTRTYPTKKALLIYGVASRTQDSFQFIERGYFQFTPFITLYEDGQLIFGRGVSEKYLSQQETQAVTTRMEQLGFFQIQDTGAIDEKNPIYSFPNDQAPRLDPDPDLVYLTVNGQESKTVLYMQPWEDYLSEPMKDIVSYLKSFSSEGATPYQPDRLLVSITVENVPEDTIVIPWPDDITPPSQRTPDDGLLYLEGAEALKLYNIEQEKNYFIYDGIKFWIYIRPILPNECHIYHYHFNEMSPNTQPFFSCDDW